MLIEQDALRSLSSGFLVLRSGSPSTGQRVYGLKNIVEDGERKRGEFAPEYLDKIEDSLYQTYLEKIHVVWPVLGTSANCKSVWEWYRSLPHRQSENSLISVVYSLFVAASAVDGHEIWENYYYNLTCSNIDKSFPGFIATSLLVSFIFTYVWFAHIRPSPTPSGLPKV
jgi:hypothetical protein